MKGLSRKLQEILKSSRCRRRPRIYIRRRNLRNCSLGSFLQIMAKHNMNEIIAVAAGISAALKILIIERADKKLIFTASGITPVQKYPLNPLMN